MSYLCHRKKREQIMAVPKFQDFLYPFLAQMKNGDVSINEMKEALINHFQLTDDDLALKTRSGNGNQLDDRINWARQWLRRALFMEIPQRGIYRITKRGAAYLKKHSTLTRADLMEYPEFASYASISTSQNGIGQSLASSPSTSESEELTPTEQLEIAYKSINDDLAADILQKTMEVSPQFFEQLVLDLLLHMGYGGNNKEMAVVTPASHDNGVDGIIPEDALGLDKIYIQAKRYKDTTVDKTEIQQFIGALDEQKASKGVFITTSTFTKGAITTANKATKKIVLINGQELANYMIEYNVGVSDKRVYKIKKIDSDYFEE